MLTVNHFEIIRRKVLLDGSSQRDVARELGHSRKTIAKALVHASPPGYQMGVGRKSPVMDRYRPLIEQWLESGKSAPPKQRHTASRIYERLRDEHEFTGNEGTARRFVAKLKAQQPKEAFMPLLFEAGEEAQVDRGEGKVIENGIQRTVHAAAELLSVRHTLLQHLPLVPARLGDVENLVKRSQRTYLTPVPEVTSKRAVGVCVDRRAYSAAAVLSVLRNQSQRPVARLDLPGRDELSDVGAGMRPLSIYDQLATHQTCDQMAEGMVLS